VLKPRYVVEKVLQSVVYEMGVNEQKLENENHIAARVRTAVLKKYFV
jgi:hypothetical protein